MMKKITLFIFLLLSASLISQVKLTSSLGEVFDGSTSSISNKTEYVYDSNNNLIEEIEYFWNTTNWLKTSETTYVYNANNMVTLEHYMFYDTTTNTISDQYKTNNTYNSSGNLIQILDEDFESGVWENSYRVDLTYENDKIVSGLSYEWSGSDWIINEDSSKLTLSYNANNLLSSTTYEEWNGTSWVISDREMLTYNASNKLILNETQTYDGTNWVTDEKTEYTYDANGNRTSEKSFSLDNGSFVENYEENFVYDTTQLMANFTHPFVDKSGIEYLFEGESPYINKIISTNSSNYRTTYNYGETTASVSDFKLSNLKVYPNPATSIINIDDQNFTIKNVELFNVIGKKVLTSTKNQLQIDGLANGVYLLRVVTNDGNFAAKRIIKN